MVEYDRAALQHLPYGRGWPEAPELPTVPLQPLGERCGEWQRPQQESSVPLMIQHSGEHRTAQRAGKTSAFFSNSNFSFKPRTRCLSGPVVEGFLRRVESRIWINPFMHSGQLFKPFSLKCIGFFVCLGQLFVTLKVHLNFKRATRSSGLQRNFPSNHKEQSRVST